MENLAARKERKITMLNQPEYVGISQGGRPIQDKSFRQALQDLQDRIAQDFQVSIQHMLLHRTSVAHTTGAIEDEKVRAIVTDMLMTGQIVALLELLKDLSLIDEVQYNEFTAYLLRSSRF
jgi:hypothetical protein